MSAQTEVSTSSVGETATAPAHPEHGDPLTTADESGVFERLADGIVYVSDALSGSEGPSQLVRFAYRHFSGPVRERSERFAEYRRTVNQARIEETYDRYLARTIATTLFVAGIGALIGLGLGLTAWSLGLFTQLGEAVRVSSPVAFPSVVLTIWAVVKLPLAIGSIAIVAAAMCAVPTFALFYKVPEMKAYEREREIDSLLPGALTFAFALSQGQITFPQIIRRLAAAEDSYGEVSRTFQSVVNNMDYFGNDLRTALRETRKNTTSDELGLLIDDMISIIDSGGEITPFLADKVDEYQETARDDAENTVDTMEAIAQGYTPAGVLFPLLSVIVGTIIVAIQGSGAILLHAIALIGTPLLSGMVIILIDTIMQDDLSSDPTVDRDILRTPLDAIEQRLEGGTTPLGRDPSAGVYGHPAEHAENPEISPDGGATATGNASRSLVKWDKQRLSEYAHRRRRAVTIQKLTSPFAQMREQPLLTLLITVPTVLVGLLGATLAGVVTPTPSGFTDNPIWTTNLAVVLPFLVVTVPIAYLHERRVRYQRRVNEALPDMLNKLAAANETGMTLQESMRLVGEGSDDLLANELERVTTELQMNTSLNGALGRMANRVENHRLTRVIVLLQEASTAAGDIRAVLRVAARDAENARSIDKEQYQTLLTHAGIVLFSALIFILIAQQLSIRLIDPLASAMQASGGRGPFGSRFNPAEVKLAMYLNALSLSIMGGLVSGKMIANDVLSGLKFSLGLVFICVVVFLFA